MPKTTKAQSKSAFIRSQPAALSAAEVVAKGKAAGIKFTSQLVYNVRGGSKAKTGTATKTSAPVTSVAIAKTATVSKADFVRAHASLSPKDVVAKGKAEGLKFDVHYVYNVRAYSKTAGKKKRAAKTTAASKSTSSNRGRRSVASSAETLLRAVAAEIGLGRAMEILAAERAMVRAVIGG